MYREAQNAINCVTKFNTSIQNNEFGETCIPFGSLFTLRLPEVRELHFISRIMSIYISRDTRFTNLMNSTVNEFPLYLLVATIRTLARDEPTKKMLVGKSKLCITSTFLFYIFFWK